MSLTQFSGGVSSMGIPFTSGINPFGTTYFVRASGGSDNNDGLNADSAFATIQKAIDTYAAGDTVVLSPGTHSVDVSTAALVPLADTQFRAAIPPMGGKPSTIITHDADDGANLVEIDVDGTGWYGIEFLIVTGSTTAVNLIDVAQATAVNGLTFEDCWFNLNDVDKAGAVRAIAVDDGTNATTGLVIRNCRFLGGSATTGTPHYIVTGVGGIPGALIENNIFVLEDAGGTGVGIVVADPGAANKNYGAVVRNNDFIGPKDYGKDAVGITFGGQDELETVFSIRNNYFSYCGTSPVTIDKMNKGLIENYYGDATTGGVLVDPGT